MSIFLNQEGLPVVKSYLSTIPIPSLGEISSQELTKESLKSRNCYSKEQDSLLIATLSTTIDSFSRRKIEQIPITSSLLPPEDQREIFFIPPYLNLLILSAIHVSEKTLSFFIRKNAYRLETTSPAQTPRDVYTRSFFYLNHTFKIGNHTSSNLKVSFFSQEEIIAPNKAKEYTLLPKNLFSLLGDINFIFLRIVIEKKQLSGFSFQKYFQTFPPFSASLESNFQNLSLRNQPGEMVPITVPIDSAYLRGSGGNFYLTFQDMEKFCLSYPSTISKQMITHSHLDLLSLQGIRIQKKYLTLWAQKNAYKPEDSQQRYCYWYLSNTVPIENHSPYVVEVSLSGKESIQLPPLNSSTILTLLEKDIPLLQGSQAIVTIKASPYEVRI